MKQIIIPLLLQLLLISAQNIEQSQRHYPQQHREDVAEEVGERSYDQMNEEDINDINRSWQIHQESTITIIKVINLV